MKYVYAALVAASLVACGGSEEGALGPKEARSGAVLCDGSPTSNCGAKDPLIGGWCDAWGNKFIIDSSGNGTIQSWVNTCYKPGMLLYSGIGRCGGDTGVACWTGWIGHTVTHKGFTLTGSCGGPYTNSADWFDDTDGASDFTDSGHGWTWHSC